MRGNTQLRVWEMQEMDEEAQTFVDRILGTHTSNDPKEDLPEDDTKQGPDTVLGGNYPGPRDIAAIAPFTMDSHSSDTIPSYNFSHTHTHNFRRPPVFGPETVVQDPRIKAVHRQLMGDVVRFGTWVLLVSPGARFSSLSC
jgi:hypothetical protein